MSNKILNAKIGLNVKSFIGLIVAVAIWMIGSLGFVMLLNMIFPATREGYASLIVAYLSFIFLPIGIYIALRFVLKTSIKEFLLNGNKVSLKMLIIYFVSTIIIFVIFMLIDFFINRDSYTVTINIISIIKNDLLFPLILLAAVSEELLFRGYLYNMFIKLKRGTLWAIIIPSILFALVHGLNAEMSANLILMPLYYFLCGVLFSLARYFTDGLGASTIIHSAFNACMFMLLSYSDSTMEAYQIQSIFYRKSMNIEYVLPVLVGITVVYYFYQQHKKRNKDDFNKSHDKQVIV
ncbi:CPBP family intramembrane glutamic endopeptidase [Clostridium intestinale]|uniref:CAAX protease self-immunity n=1 Tax=Clostridium intestinale DSM 6191 TaxID=1121320 RepID=A0A1M5YLM3_9CLOT|nr:type II CAAX endopeptidase family protein [Clostridium intestinale]SHI12744.1 CAAX protease self-immunity [Clostridium intestinale DSM 6191]